MKLAEATDVQELIRFKDIEEIGDALNIALDAVTSELEKKIRTSFPEATRYDIFRAKHQEVDIGLYEYHWRLANGFVVEDEDFTVKVASSMADLTTAAATDITDDCIINKEKGLVSYIGAALGTFVRIDYTSGFTDNGDVYEDVPDWLEKAAIYAAIIHIDTVSPTLRHNTDEETSTSGLRRIYGGIVTAHERYFPKYDNPVVKS